METRYQRMMGGTSISPASAMAERWRSSLPSSVAKSKEFMIKLRQMGVVPSILSRWYIHLQLSLPVPSFQWRSFHFWKQSRGNIFHAKSLQVGFQEFSRWYNPSPKMVTMIIIWAWTNSIVERKIHLQNHRPFPCVFFQKCPQRVIPLARTWDPLYGIPYHSHIF